MADIEHKNATDPNIHEPKGIASAASGTTYLADGAGGGNWESPIGDIPTILISQESDFPTPAAGVITLAANTDYQVTASFSTANRFAMSSNTLLRGIDRTQQGLTYTGTGTMFTSVDLSFKIRELSLSCPLAELLNVSSTSGFDSALIQDVTIFSCDTIGTVDNMGSFVLQNIVIVSVITDGVTFLNNIGGLLVIEILAIMTAGSFLDLGTATFNNFSFSTSGITLNGASVMLRGLGDANINAGGLGAVFNTRATGAGSALAGGISNDDGQWNFLLNDETPDTRPDALLTNVAGTTVTIGVVNTPVKVSGTWIDERSSQMTINTNGRATYDPPKAATVPMGFTMSLEPVSGTNQNITAYIAINGTAVANSGVSLEVDSGAPQNVVVLWQEELNATNFVEVFVENNTGTINIQVNNATLRIN